MGVSGPIVVDRGFFGTTARALTHGVPTAVIDRRRFLDLPKRQMAVAHILWFRTVNKRVFV